VGVVNGSTGKTAATLVYSPFGELIARDGDTERDRYGFSTKWGDGDTGMRYYGYRFYSADTGRWPNRDPLGEQGGVNLHGFVGNDTVSKIDLLGQITVTIVPPGLQKFDCGGFAIRWGIRLDNAAQTDGYIIQHIKLAYKAKTCAGTSLNDSLEYWEAIPITAGQFFPVDNGAPANDYWHYDSSPGTIGNIQMTGELKFFPTSVTGNLGNFNQKSPSPIFPPWTAGGSYGGLPQIPGIPMPPYPVDSGSFPSTGQQPGFWNQPAIEQLIGFHAITRSWKCCCPWVDPNEGQVF